MKKYKNILIIGAGLTGITLAERFASQGSKVLIIEKRDHIGGNCYDYQNRNRNGILIHKYGPHIFNTDHKEVWDYLSKFTDWIYYQHRVLGAVDGKFVPIPFNLNTLYELFSPRFAGRLEEKLIKKFDYGKKIPILELKKARDRDLKFLADFVYEKIFLHYSEKQWGLKPEDIDSSVTARVPVVVSRDNRYYPSRYQGIPQNGYTKIFERMLRNKKIEIQLNKEFKAIKNKAKYDLMFCTGPIDEFFEYKFERLEYRCIRIDFRTLDKESFQPVSVVNYPNNYDFTRITEFKKFRGEETNDTVIGIEYPGEEGFPAWPVLNKKNNAVFQKYRQEAEKLKKKNVYFVGRLAEYKYYDIDDAVKNALDLFNKICP